MLYSVTALCQSYVLKFKVISNVGPYSTTTDPKGTNKPFFYTDLFPFINAPENFLSVGFNVFERTTSTFPTNDIFSTLFATRFFGERTQHNGSIYYGDEVKSSFGSFNPGSWNLLKSNYPGSPILLSKSYFLFTPKRADTIKIVSQNKPSYCPGDVIKITTTDLYIGKKREYIFQAYVGEKSEESFSWSASSGTPTWVYTVPAFNSSKKTRTFTVKIKGVPTFYDLSDIGTEETQQSILEGQESVRSPVVNFSHSAPTANITITPPTCKEDKDGKINLYINGYLGKGVDEYGVGLSLTASGITSSIGGKNPFSNEFYNGKKKYIDIPNETLCGFSFAAITLSGTDLYYGLVAGNYTMQLRNYSSTMGGQCFNTYNFTISQPYTSFTSTGSALLKSTSTQYHTSCVPGNDGSISLNSGGPIGQYAGRNGYVASYLVKGGLNSNGKTYTANPTDLAGNASYTIQAIDNYNCFSSKSDSVAINSPPALTITAAVLSPYANNTQISCKGNSDGSIQLTAGAGSGVGNYTFQLSKTGYTPPSQIIPSSIATFSSLSEGGYTATITDGFGCAKTINNITVEEPNAISITGVNRPKDFNPKEYNGYDVSCHAANDGHIEVLASGGTTIFPLLYSFAGNNLVYTFTGGLPIFTANAHFRNLPQQSPLIFYVKDANGCTTSAGITLDSIPTALSVAGIVKQLYNGFNISCNNNSNSDNNGNFTNGRVTISGGGGIFNKSYNFSIDGETFTYTSKDNYYTHSFASLTTGTHNFAIKDNNNCIVSDTFWLSEPPRLRLKTYDPHAPACKGYNDGYINFEAAGGVPTLYNYTLSGKGLYHNPPQNPVYSTKNNQQNLTSFAGITKDNYGLNIKDDNGCTFDTTVQISEPDLLKISTLLGSIPCKGESTGNVVASVTGGTLPYTYIWALDRERTSIIPREALGTITGLSKNQTYFLHLTDANNCSNNGKGQQYLVQSVSLQEPVDSILFKQSQLIMPLCNGQSNGSILVKISGGWGSYSYSYDNVSFSGIGQFRNLSKGIYTLYVKDRMGCLKDTTFDLGEPQQLSIQVKHKDVQCFQKKNGMIVITASGGTMGYSYKVTLHGLLSPIESLIPIVTFSGLDIGAYAPFINDVNGCTVAGAAINISQPTLLQLNSSHIDATCGEPTGSASVTVSGGVTPYQYSWNGVIATNTTTQINQILSGNYGVVATDGNLCQVSATAIIADRDGPKVIGKLIAGTSCYLTADAKALIQVTSLRQNKTIQTFEWKTVNNSQAIGSTTSTATGLAGNQSVTGIAIDSDGCRGVANIFVTSPEPILISLKSKDPVCNNEKNGSITATVKGGTVPYQYSWDDDLQQSFSVLANVPAFQLLGDSLTQYKLVLLDKNNCTAIDSATIYNPKEVRVNIPDSSVICVGQSYTLNAQNPGLTHQWTSKNGFASSEREVLVNKDGLYKIRVVNAKGCFATDSFKLRTSSALLNAEFANVDTLYVGDTLRLAEISWPAPDSVVWNFPKGISKLTNSKLNVKYKEKEYVYIIATDTGNFQLTLNAYLGQCDDKKFKTIQVEAFSQKPFSGGRWGIQGIRSYQLFPNPTSGLFTLQVELTDLMPLEVTIYNGITSNLLISKLSTENFNHSLNFDLEGYPSGLYVAVISSNSQRKVVKFMKE